MELEAERGRELARQGLTVLIPATAPLRRFRERAKELAPAFVEVWVDTPLEECVRRDAKGLFRARVAGSVRDVPGAARLLKNAPPPSTLSSLAGGLGSLLGGRNSTAGRWAGLAASFTELGVDLDTAKKFGPIIMEHVRKHGGDDLLDKLKGALKL